MIGFDAAQAAQDWRPQRYGDGRAAGVDDALIEPQWAGIRTIVHVSRGLAVSRDEDGDAIGDAVDLLPEIAAAARAETLILDGFLTNQLASDGVGIGAEEIVKAPTTGQAASQLFLGRWRNRSKELEEAAAEEQRLHRFSAGLPAHFVAVDLLWLDDDPLLEVPLLERKRLLESGLDESEHVRRTAYVRTPVGPWLGSWRSAGFSRLVYKASNGHYHPGEKTADWLTAAIPK